MAARKKSEVPAEPPQENGVVTVSWRGGSRVYSQEMHGDDFRALAAEFAAKKGGSIA